jgi:CRP-like cAMP-binding protein
MDLRIFLANLPSFSGFSPAELNLVEGTLKLASYPAGHVFTRQGEPGDAMHVLLEGNVRVTEHDEIAGLSQEVKDLHSGELFGLLSLISQMPAAATCTATSAVKAASLSRDDFDRLMQAAPRVGHHLYYMVAVQLARDLQTRNRSMREVLRREANAIASR